MNLLDLFIRLGVKDEASDKVSSLGNKIKTSLTTAGKVAAAGVGLITGAATAAAGALSALESATEEYRIAQGKLNTAFEAAGYSAEAAQQSYNAFYGILGDIDTATEASQLLAKLAENEEDIATWTDIAAGVYGTFGDSLPIEGLIEAANETAKVGTVTGTLADALNWAGISEDDFNIALSECTDEAGRNQLIMQTLSGTYDEASDAFYRNNEALVASRNAQAKVDASLAKLGSAVSNVKTRLMGEFLPSISSVVDGLAGLLSGAEGAEQAFSSAIGNLINTAVARLPEFLNFGVQMITAIANGLIQNLPAIVSAVPLILQSFVTAAQALFPTIVNAGSELLAQLADGIIIAIPYMLEQLPQVITAFIEFVTENFPAIVENGAEFLAQLTAGIIGAIPAMVAQLPALISAFVAFIINAFPTIIQAGAELLGKFTDGILGAVSGMVSKLKGVVDNIVDTFKNGYELIKSAGSYLLEGLWAGISDKIEWLKGKVAGVVDTIKSWFTGSDGFDTHSPSRWSKKIMGYVMEGAGDGLVDGLPGVMRNVRSVSDTIKGGMDFGTASVDFASSGLGVSSAGMVNGIAAAAQGATNGGNYTFNLVLPDGSKLASYTFQPLVDYARANGTPILNPT